MKRRRFWLSIALAVGLFSAPGCAHLSFDSDDIKCGCTGESECQCGESAEDCPCQ